MIGIIAAMAQEAAYLKQHMSSLTSFTVGESVFSTGYVNDKPIVLLECGIGKVNAAIGATLLIERFKPDYIINTGVAGGLNSELKIGDVVISIEVRHHDVDLTVWGYEHGQLPKAPVAYTPSELLVEAASAAAQKLAMHVSHGLIISGDSFIHEQAQIAKIQEKFAKAHAVEMEAAAIAQVCHQFKVPFVIIRALSDIAGQDSSVSFETFLDQAAKNSAELILHTLIELKS